MTLYDLKPVFQARLRPLAGRLAARGITANQVTIAAALISLLVGGLIWLSGARIAFLLLPFWYGLRMAFNAVDGMLAREHGQKSRLGAFLNELGDVVSDAALIAPFAVLPVFYGFAVGLVVVLALLTEFAGVLAEALGGGRRYDGPMGKSDRALVFGSAGAWIGLSLPLPGWSVLFLYVLAALLVWTVVNRVSSGLAEALKGRSAA